jgi:hypothetical protein
MTASTAMLAVPSPGAYCFSTMMTKVASITDTNVISKMIRPAKRRADGMSVATRNIPGFEDCGLDLVNLRDA